MQFNYLARDSRECVSKVAVSISWMRAWVPAHMGSHIPALPATSDAESDYRVCLLLIAGPRRTVLRFREEGSSLAEGEPVRVAPLEKTRER